MCNAKANKIIPICKHTKTIIVFPGDLNISGQQNKFISLWYLMAIPLWKSQDEHTQHWKVSQICQWISQSTCKFCMLLAVFKKKNENGCMWLGDVYQGYWLMTTYSSPSAFKLPEK